MRVGIIGAGTVGIYCAIELLEALPDFIQLDLIYSSDIPPLGVGESTLVNFPQTLTFGIDYVHSEDKHELNSTTKYGIQFKNWNGNKFIPFASGSHGIQFDTTRFASFAIPRLKQKYKNFTERIKTIKEIKSLGKKVSVDGSIYDYVVDCRGYPKDYSDYIICDNVYLNAAITVRSYTTVPEESTYHIAHEHGWMFGIPLLDRTAWGYLYNSDITSQLEAQSNLLSILENYQIEFKSSDCREFSFKNYYAKSIVNEDGNIFLNGNRALFLEPIQATSLGCYGLINGMIIDAILNKVYDMDKYNIVMEEVVKFINLHYYKGSDFDTPFWRYASESAQKLLQDIDIPNYNWNYVIDWNPQFRSRMFNNFL